MKLLDESLLVKSQVLFSPSPSYDGKEGTGMQISAIVEAKRKGEPTDLMIKVFDVLGF